MSVGVSRLVSPEIQRFNMGEFEAELNKKGLMVLPPEVTGVSMVAIDCCSNALLQRFREETGCDIGLDEGRLGRL